jgi:hypothetical protein
MAAALQRSMTAKQTLFSTILILTVVAAGFALAAKGYETEPKGDQLQQQKLPREWVWKKKEVKFDDMYRR